MRNTTAYRQGVKYANITMGIASPVPDLLLDTAMATAQSAGLEAISSDEESRKENAIRGGVGSAGATLLNELPWHVLARKLRYTLD